MEPILNYSLVAFCLEQRKQLIFYFSIVLAMCALLEIKNTYTYCNENEQQLPSQLRI